MSAHNGRNMHACTPARIHAHMQTPINRYDIHLKGYFVARQLPITIHNYLLCFIRRVTLLGVSTTKWSSSDH